MCDAGGLDQNTGARVGRNGHAPSAILLLFGSALLAGCTNPTFEAEGQVCGHEAAIFYGDDEPQRVTLDPSEIRAIVRIDAPGTTCTGTVIAPRWVVTAAHCQGDLAPSDLRVVVVGEGQPRRTRSVGVIAVEVHPRLDVALYRLDANLTEGVLPVSPIPIRSMPIDDMRGLATEAVGFGKTETGHLGDRHFYPDEVAGVGQHSVTVDGRQRRGACFGDSGAPLLSGAVDGGAEMLGVLSTGDESCVGRDHFVRLDRLWSWIDANVPNLAPPRCHELSECPEVAADCPAVGLGRCDGDVALTCDDGVVRAIDCGICGQTCVPDATLGARCTSI